MRPLLALGLAVALLAAGCAEEAAAGSPGVRLVRVGTFATPVHVTAPAADRRRLFVVEQRGVVRVVRRGRVLRRPFLDLRDRVRAGGEQGLLSLAFAPDYARSRRFYVYYTDRGGDQRVVELRRSRRSADRANRATARTVLVHQDREPNHNGGLLLFGPDRRLYVGTGDGGGGYDRHGRRGNAQDLSSPLGKILRIDPRRAGRRRFTVPAGNPFVGRRGVRPEIYVFGLRNPWRFAFDPATGDLAVGDVGQDRVEEITFLPRGTIAGANLGWRPFEGRRRLFDEPAPGHVAPVIELQHADGNCSVTGGVFVRDRALRALAGRYVYGDFCAGRLRSARLTPGAAQGDAAVGLRVPALSSFGTDARGRVHVVSLEGPVYRLAPR
ncbi:MAG: PQQ-dependent sugar dehydrogenase, partial [Actinomycetota bacterium]|nr:PQQ-dependent sugar dehydrogenase [Actinomycetota bacterium]